MSQFLACKKVLDKGVEGHLRVPCATKLDKSHELASAICKPLKSLNNRTAQRGVIAAKDRENK
jgi:hypothetical protein